MEHSQDEIIGERRTAILESLGRKEGDVMEDEKGEYVLVEGGEDTPAHNEVIKFNGNDDPDVFEKLYLSDVELD